MKRKAFSTLLLSTLLCGTCYFQTSCRSTLYKAAERGDIETVHAELAKNKTIDSYARGPQNIFLLPIGATALTIDVANLALMIGTLGIYYHCLPTDRPFLLPRMLKNPIDAALDGGHYEIANMLAARGDKPIFDKHYHGGKNAAAKRNTPPRATIQQPTAKQPEKTQKKSAAKPKQQVKESTPQPKQLKKKTPTMQSAAGSVN